MRASFEWARRARISAPRPGPGDAAAHVRRLFPDRRTGGWSSAETGGTERRPEFVARCAEKLGTDTRAGVGARGGMGACTHLRMYTIVHDTTTCGGTVSPEQ